MSAPEATARDLAGQFITFMETGTPPEGLFTPDNDKWRTVLNYGLPAVVYLLIAHAVAGRVNRA